MPSELDATGDGVIRMSEEAKIQFDIGWAVGRSELPRQKIAQIMREAAYSIEHSGQGIAGANDYRRADVEGLVKGIQEVALTFGRLVMVAEELAVRLQSLSLVVELWEPDNAK